ncbi:MAG: response regulator transcription factor [Aquificae bacterium]|nr:response regulator transcription factor [Aquificota bacterium]
MPLIYVVEDDEDINELLVYNLTKEGFDVEPFYSSKPAYTSIKQKKPDLIILDIMLPDMDGLELCKLLKSEKETADIPVIMLTAKSTEIDKIVGLELGADDYITKPFSIRELIARIRAILRRIKRRDCQEEVNIYKKYSLLVDFDKFLVLINDKNIKLTGKEFKLLSLLIKSEGKVLSREYILNVIWQDEDDVYDRTVDVHIRHLREKLKDYGKFIKTVRGIGYKWETD